MLAHQKQRRKQNRNGDSHKPSNLIKEKRKEHQPQQKRKPMELLPLKLFAGLKLQPNLAGNIKAKNHKTISNRLARMKGQKHAGKIPRAGGVNRQAAPGWARGTDEVS